MAANGFKSFAPVLPGLGLHSFHNDSPPFAGAATSEQGEPEYLSLESSQILSSPSPHDDSQLAPERNNYMNHNGNNHSQSSSTHHSNSNSNSSNASGSRPKNININGPIPQRSPNDHSDEDLSSSRSRRLLSGYLFGNPPSSSEAQDNSPRGSHGNGNGHSDAQGQQGRILIRRPSSDSEEGRYPLPTPPIFERDSPPLSEAFKSYSSPSAQHQSSILSPTPPEPEHLNGISQISLNDDPAETDTINANSGTVAVTNATRIKKPDPEDSDSRDGAESPTEEQIHSHEESGYDALNGLNDGEADLDTSAPQATDGGSGAYLRGEVDYSFPRHRLRKTMKDESKIPLVIVACGSFSPPTYLHLRMFEMAKDEIIESQTYEIMAGYYSPVSSYYKKSGLAPANHRVRMCELAVEHTSTWLMVDPWEAGQSEYQRTAIVLDHFDEMLNGGKNGEGGVVMGDGKKRRYKIMLLAGGDLIESFGEPGVWSEPDLHVILGRFGCLIVERAGSDVWAFLLSHDILYHHRRNVIVIKQLIYNDISSTKVRLFVRRGMSIKYLLPNSVIQYIYDNKLYRYTDVKATIG
ncbi:nicotinate (nicotinamide) nucleotide adenylyltransferase [Kwoniella shivajii]|uniref:Nicotinate (Nicotinamide) nucleotide adenylyltransferase n=1 Tax=Kwoniella shivajii TaxID=564305 RepID=A0ABZ1D6A8_9TREE|nr:nicotinate (nicotinamide) nucleotide adenylyltransferase [Kwoniella shivajii]